MAAYWGGFLDVKVWEVGIRSCCVARGIGFLKAVRHCMAHTQPVRIDVVTQHGENPWIGGPLENDPFVETFQQLFTEILHSYPVTNSE